MQVKGKAAARKAGAVPRKRAGPSTTGKLLQFCRQMGMDPDDFISNTGWMKAGRWANGIDWKGFVGWKRLGRMPPESGR
jgi:hypothetical protein